MHGATTDSTFGFIAARAARYPVIVRRSQPRTIVKGSPCRPVAGDPGIRWLLLNTLATDRFLKGTGLERATQGNSRLTGF
jgi:hypothetical protein